MFRVLCCALSVFPALHAANHDSGAGISRGLQEISIDAGETYRVRDLTLTRGDLKIYLTEGILSFSTPVANRTVAAVFTTTDVEAGDAEILLLPLQRSERASLASFTKTPNLDEHFTSAIFFFSDNTLDELMSQIRAAPVRKAPELAPNMAAAFTVAIRQLSSGIEIRLVQSLLDSHTPEHGFFYSTISGRNLGVFDVMYEPDELEPIAVGRESSGSTGSSEGTQSAFRLWTTFRPRKAPPYVSRRPKLSDFQIDATIHEDLSMSVTARFHAVPNSNAGRVISLGLSDRLKVISASIDGKSVEVFQPDSSRNLNVKGSGTFLLISDTPLETGKDYGVEIRYEGSVIRQTRDGLYFVDERNAWFPYSGPTLASFDLTFRCPERLRLVSTGELVSDEVANGIRIVKRKTQVPERFAGFNLGNYDLISEEHGAYRVECYANRAAAASLAKEAKTISDLPAANGESVLQELPKRTESILDDYTRRWMPLPIHSVAVSPIPGYFGQGFPGLIYLSTVSYLREQDRPSELRSARMDTFFSEMLLPHEVAHQWWGNVVSAADYRTEWLMEAMANYSALQLLGRTKGADAMKEVLATYREDLSRQQNGKVLDSAGPVDFGTRLQQMDMRTWHTIVYEKGTWIVHMLHERLGDQGFERMQMRLLKDFATKPITNEDLRRIAADVVPPGQPDKALTLFFDTWIHGTGIPTLRVEGAGRDLNVDVSGVDEDFTADIGLRCTSKSGAKEMHWMRVSAGSNPVEMDAKTAHCELPDMSEFLYVAGLKSGDSGS
ncbi:MAG: hypothetical protein JOY62_07230 [Acidobacteriaceae bacterium]|nr:hypothetical protein [Acidobacteriaceae bacterium]MBV9779750.1 hypothetical protein [Acidobacteriaceae bacterium]